MAAVKIGDDPEAAVKDADCVVTDTWVSMGDRDGKHRHNVLKRYQVNARLMSKAKPDALFMHRPPAHRGEEVTDEVIDGPQSVVFDEAENRLHAQKGLLAWRRTPRRKATRINAVMPGLVPGIHAVVKIPGRGMAGTSPAMTIEVLGLDFASMSAT